MSKQFMTANESVRDSIGLTAAESGDVQGLAQFVSFIDRELLAVSMATYPTEIGNRLYSLRGESKALRDFIAGWIAATTVVEERTPLSTPQQDQRGEP